MKSIHAPQVVACYREYFESENVVVGRSSRVGKVDRDVDVEMNEPKQLKRRGIVSHLMTDR